MNVGSRRSTSFNSYQSSTNLSESSPLISQTSVDDSATGISDESNAPFSSESLELAGDEKFYFVQKNAESTGYDNTIDIVPNGTEGRDFSSIPVIMEGDHDDAEILKRSDSCVELKHGTAIKIEPKIFFSNERTFLAWINTSVLLTGSSIVLTSFSQDSLSQQLYGAVLLSLSIAFICYGMYQYSRRSRMMIRKSPGPYEEIVGPAALGIVLMLSILVQFSLQMYSDL